MLLDWYAEKTINLEQNQGLIDLDLFPRHGGTISLFFFSFFLFFAEKFL
jgi:hypothetical protein